MHIAQNTRNRFVQVYKVEQKGLTNGAKRCIMYTVNEVEVEATVEAIVAQLGLTLTPAVYAEVVELALAEAYAEVYAE